MDWLAWSSAETTQLTQTQRPAGGVRSEQWRPQRSQDPFRAVPDPAPGGKPDRRGPDDQTSGPQPGPCLCPKPTASGHALCPVSSRPVNVPESTPCRLPGKKTATPHGHWRSQSPQVQLPMPFPSATFLANHSCLISRSGLPLCSQAPWDLCVFSTHLGVWNCLSASSPSTVGHPRLLVGPTGT